MDTTDNTYDVGAGSGDVEQDAPILVILDDDCLLEIFGLLDIDDLPSVASVCIRFNKNAKKIFAAKFKTQSVWLGTRNNDDWLLNFGSMMESVKIHWVGTLEEVSKHCKSLKTLKIAASGHISPYINFVQLDEELMKKHQPLFSRLEKLSFENCLLMDHIKTGLIGCRQLKFLSIKNKLLIEYQCLLNQFDDDKLEERERMMPFANFHSSEFFRSIEEYVPNLEELHIHVKYMEDLSNFQRDVLSLSNLHSLKVLEMHMYGKSASNLMGAIAENNIQLENLELKDGKMDASTIENICKIKSINEIEIVDFYSFDNEYLVPLADGLPQLTSLKVIHPEYGGDRINKTIVERMLLSGKKLSNLSVFRSCYDGIHSDADAIEAYEAILAIISKREEKIGLNIWIAPDEPYRNDNYEMETDLDNGERFKFCVHFDNPDLGMTNFHWSDQDLDDFVW